MRRKHESILRVNVLADDTSSNAGDTDTASTMGDDCIPSRQSFEEVKLDD